MLVVLSAFLSLTVAAIFAPSSNPYCSFGLVSMVSLQNVCVVYDCLGPSLMDIDVCFWCFVGIRSNMSSLTHYIPFHYVFLWTVFTF